MNQYRWAYFWMLLSAVSFSGMSFLTNQLRDSFPWQIIAIMRTGIALAIVLLLARLAHAPLAFVRPTTLWVRSLAGSAALLCNFYSLTHYPAPEVQALSTMFPLWVAVLSWPVLRERPGIKTWCAAILGVLGVFVLQQPQSGLYSMVPVIAAVGASFASAIALLGLHRLKSVNTTAVVAHFSAVSLLCSVAALWLFPFTVSAKPPSWPAMLLLGCVGLAGTCGQLLLTRAFANAPPAQVSVIGLSQVAFTMLLESFFLGRAFSPVSLLGFALVVGPTAWVMVAKRDAETLPA